MVPSCVVVAHCECGKYQKHQKYQYSIHFPVFVTIIECVFQNSLFLEEIARVGMRLKLDILQHPDHDHNHVMMSITLNEG